MQEEIVPKKQWDSVEALHELGVLEEHIRTFIAHTIRTMSTPSGYDTPFGWVDEGAVRHPMMSFLSVIKACREGCYMSYGETMFKQGVLFDRRFQKED